MPIVRPALAADLDAIAAIYAHYVTDSVATFEETVPGAGFWADKHADLTGRGLPFLVVEDEGRVAGYAYAGPWRSKSAYRFTVEDTIYLDPAAAGRGLGSLLLGGLLDACATAGIRQVIAVISDPGGDASVALHRRHGFTDAGRLADVGFKHDRWLGTLFMQRTLS
ncbi:GNAT family N-acetyltransferase [Catenuloplanes japonicus]|uniref:GNAT family N-acetyltransferase n=1 Tax=Catenuloplanes japonicus TaxID=33876 RepID=UPI000525CCE8|nr:GNAT family N-acetyltransferase [Catenuloplanes japonicus]